MCPNGASSTGDKPAVKHDFLFLVGSGNFQQVVFISLGKLFFRFGQGGTQLLTLISTRFYFRGSLKTAIQG